MVSKATSILPSVLNLKCKVIFFNCVWYRVSVIVSRYWPGYTSILSASKLAIACIQNFSTVVSAPSTLFFLLYTVVIPDTVADDVLKSLLSHPDLDELFDVESLLPHMMRRRIVTATDQCQIKQLPSQTEKVMALINAVKRKGQSKTKLTLLYASVYDSYEEQHGHGKHYDALRILLQKGMKVTNW